VVCVALFYSCVHFQKNNATTTEIIKQPRVDAYSDQHILPELLIFRNHDIVGLTVL